ncbi:hypothetical protein VTK73DRAFT_1883 [Phialemonium thermophilum]|uniref:BZIP domain-containing protein n=1 Tax=Phialemonium thermophilum TaxID=223376 RepID=A0ABR3VST3_9PEZI
MLPAKLCLPPCIIYALGWICHPALPPCPYEMHCALGILRAFRQRKEQYIKKLEQEVRDYAELENNLKAVQAENYGLREYIITLQSRLLDLHGECPQPPPNVNLAPPHIPPPGVSPSAEQPGTANSVSGTATSLEVVAQAVAGLARGDHLSDSGQYPERALKSEGGEADPKSTEDSSRQAQLGNIPSAPM